MVTLEVKFKCEICGTVLMHELRIGPNFFLGADQVPVGWVVRVEEYAIRAYCPEHNSRS
jgi:hypothetical protein